MHTQKYTHTHRAVVHVCMYVCMYVYIYIYIHIYIHADPSPSIASIILTEVEVHTQKYTRTCKNTYTHTHTQGCHLILQSCHRHARSKSFHSLNNDNWFLIWYSQCISLLQAQNSQSHACAVTYVSYVVFPLYIPVASTKESTSCVCIDIGILSG
jgi:hypothetical protein